MNGDIAGRLREAMIITTHRFRDCDEVVNSGTTTPTRSLRGSRAQKLQELMDTGAFGCEAPNAARAFSILTDSEILPERRRAPANSWLRRSPVGSLAAIVPVKGSTPQPFFGTQFSDEETYLVLNLDSEGDLSCANLEGSRTSLFRPFSGSYRLANDGEINRFVDRFSPTDEVLAQLRPTLTGTGF